MNGSGHPVPAGHGLDDEGGAADAVAGGEDSRAAGHVGVGVDGDGPRARHAHATHRQGQRRAEVPVQVHQSQLAALAVDQQGAVAAGGPGREAEGAVDGLDRAQAAAVGPDVVRPAA